jgi:Protein of unknown function (DUF2971).
MPITSYPTLYRYVKLADYSIDDIINNRISLSAISEFNDLFDSTYSPYESIETRDKQIEEKKDKLKTIVYNNGLDGLSEFINSYSDIQKEISDFNAKMGYRALNGVGVYVCCFSTSINSVLMWSHYADSNKGICISYDFNQLPKECFLRNVLFPLKYSNTPPIINDISENVDALPLNICETVLRKSNVWSYEKEWRLFVVSHNKDDHLQRGKITLDFIPNEISFGYHFLKNYCYYNDNNESNSISELKRLLQYIIDKNIRTSLALPVVGKYELQIKPIDTKELLTFIIRNFKNDMPQDIKYYYAIQDELMKIMNQE